MANPSPLVLRAGIPPPAPDVSGGPFPRPLPLTPPPFGALPPYTVSAMANMQQLIRTPITDMFGVKHPVILAGMNVAAGARLASAVTNAGGLGVIGGVNYTPAQLQAVIDKATRKKTQEEAD